MTELLHSKKINDGKDYKEDDALLEKARSPWLAVTHVLSYLATPHRAVRPLQVGRCVLSSEHGKYLLF